MGDERKLAMIALSPLGASYRACEQFWLADQADIADAPLWTIPERLIAYLVI